MAVAAPPHRSVDPDVRTKRALLGTRGLAVLDENGDLWSVAAEDVGDENARPAGRVKGGIDADWTKLVDDLRGALDDDDRGVDALEALGAAARAQGAGAVGGLCEAAAAASDAILGEAPTCGFASDASSASTTLVLRFVERRERRHGALLEALAECARCLDERTADGLADAAARAARGDRAAIETLQRRPLFLLASSS